MIVSILQSNYIPWKGYFDLIARSDVFVIYDEVQYTKNDWRNRNLIKTPNGLQWLTIPVRQEFLEQKICETKVSSGVWARKHIAAIQANYARAPFYGLYRKAIFDLYETNSEFLSVINSRLIVGICELLGITTQIIDSRSLALVGDKNTRLIEACKVLGASKYLSGPAARIYLDVATFCKEGIAVEWMDYSGYREYSQLYPPFQHNVSILDLLFNVGPDSRKHIANYL